MTFDNVKKEISVKYKKSWQELLTAIVDLTEKSMRDVSEAVDHEFTYPWLEIGPGYAYGPAFGHWDIVHAAFNFIAFDKEEVKKQLINNFTLQQDDGRLVGAVFFKNNKKYLSTIVSHPPLWVFLASELYLRYGDVEFLETCYDAIKKQIAWFEKERQSDDGAFIYHDVSGERRWEIGMDESIRFVNITPCRKACIDACAHVYALYSAAYEWSVALKKPSQEYLSKGLALKEFVLTNMWDEKSGWFYDTFIPENERKVEALEGMWPMVAGMCDKEKAKRIVENLMSEKHFFTEHPCANVSISSDKFKLQMWQGGTFNSMTFWAAYGMFKNGFYEECKLLVERALDATDKIYKETGLIWEFYHPFGENPLKMQRKPQNAQNTPCSDYLGHSPLLAMADLWEKCNEKLS